jgi:hypothetical protein
MGLRRAAGTPLTRAEGEILSSRPGELVDAGALPNSTSRADGKYTIETRPTDGRTDQPAMLLQPDRALDHNGAFYDGANARRVRVDAGQMFDANGQAVPLNQVAVFRGHGSRGGFEGISTREAARLAADAIVLENQGRAPGQRIGHLLLQACSQGDKGWLLFGESNAQAFQRYLGAELQARGVNADVTVLASDKAGPLFVTGTDRYLNNAKVPARFIPAAQQQPGTHFTTMDKVLVAGGGALAAEFGGIAYLIYKDKK